MSDSRRRTLVSVRAKRTTPHATTTVFCRSHPFVLGKPWIFDIAEPSVTGLEQLPGILLTDVNLSRADQSGPSSGIAVLSQAFQNPGAHS